MLGALCAGLVLSLAACGGSTTSAPLTTTANGLTIGTSSSALYGTILTTDSGSTLYGLVGDSSTMSTCNGTCIQTWRPLTTRGVTSTRGDAKQSLITTLTRVDGTRQVVYAGHPLYTYVGDTEPRQVNGQGTNSTWFVVNAAGQLVLTAPGHPSSTT
jgi:predicted lipoprotein with Yx(FWY)xxD motif